MAGLIEDCSESALPLLGYSFRGIRGRPLPIMFIENRLRYDELAAVFRGVPVERTGVIRPRERRGVTVRFVVEVARELGRHTGVLRWTFTDMTAGRQRETRASLPAPEGDAARR